MKPLARSLLLVTALTSPLAALAALPVGASAPTFSVPAALAGEAYTFSLQQALMRGPVVLYFYPAAFSSGCTLEAHAFAEAIDDFSAAGASVIGVSHDKLETLEKFSVSACGGKFPVGADTDQQVMKAYDAVHSVRTGHADRISYVISPEGKVVQVFDSMDPEQHVASTLRAVQTWASQQPAAAKTRPAP